MMDCGRKVVPGTPKSLSAKLEKHKHEGQFQKPDPNQEIPTYPV